MLRDEAAVDGAVSGFWEKVEGVGFRGGFFLQKGKFLFPLFVIATKSGAKKSRPIQWLRLNWPGQRPCSPLRFFGSS